MCLLQPTISKGRYCKSQVQGGFPPKAVEEEEALIAGGEEGAEAALSPICYLVPIPTLASHPTVQAKIVICSRTPALSDLALMKRTITNSRTDYLTHKPPHCPLEKDD